MGDITRKMMMSSNAEILYKPYRFHPILFNGIFLQEWVHPDFFSTLNAFKQLPEPAELDDTFNPDNVVSPNLLHKEMDDVYSFNVFNTNFLTLFNDEIHNFYTISEQHNINVRRPNSMNNYGVIVNEIGLRSLITSFQQTYLWPVARYLFPIQGSQFDSHHSFIVRYRSDEDLGLDMHTDDSDVTFNVCLGDTFEGATLSFCGMFGKSDHRQFRHTYQHKVGRAILHLGNRRHGADDIKSGTRSNLIVWNHNEKFRRRGVNAWDRDEVYEAEGGEPSPVCLSYTHDRDYTNFKTLPEAALKQKRRPWCPPPGREYPSYKDHE